MREFLNCQETLHFVKSQKVRLIQHFAFNRSDKMNQPEIPAMEF
jgi:hypothetical protein